MAVVLFYLACVGGMRIVTVSCFIFLLKVAGITSFIWCWEILMLTLYITRYNIIPARRARTFRVKIGMGAQMCTGDLPYKYTIPVSGFSMPVSCTCKLCKGG